MKYLRTHENHLSGTWLEHFQTFPGPVFLNKVGQCRRVPVSPIEEAAEAARLIHAENGAEEIALCLSGGVDSEAMARAFLHAKVPFKAYIFRFENAFNDYDIKDAVGFVQSNGITHEIIDIDAIKYFESGRYLEEAGNYLCNSPQLCLHIHMLDKIPGCPVLSWNAPYIEHDPFGIGLPQYKYWSYNRYFEKKGRPGVPFFFLYTQELIYAFIRQPLFQGLMKNPKSASYNYGFKCDLYRSGGFAITNREDKFTGFEKLRAHYDKMSGEIDRFNRLFRHPLEKMIPAPRSQVSLINEDYLFV